MERLDQHSLGSLELIWAQHAHAQQVESWLSHQHRYWHPDQRHLHRTPCRPTPVVPLSGLERFTRVQALRKGSLVQGHPRCPPPAPMAQEEEEEESLLCHRVALLQLPLWGLDEPTLHLQLQPCRHRPLLVDSLLRACHGAGTEAQVHWQSHRGASMSASQAHDPLVVLVVVVRLEGRRLCLAAQSPQLLQQQDHHHRQQQHTGLGAAWLLALHTLGLQGPSFEAVAARASRACRQAPRWRPASVVVEGVCTAEAGRQQRLEVHRVSCVLQELCGGVDVCFFE